MKIREIRTLSGPNVYSHDPVLVMKLDLENLAGKESFEIEGFIDRLLALLPGVQEHYCGLGRPGGFVERLRGGTYFGHIVEHVALELTDRVGISVNRGKTVSAGEPGVYLVAVAYRSEAGMNCLLHIAVDLVQSLVDHAPYPLEEKLAEARKIVADTELGPSTRAIVDAASRRGIPWTRVDENSLVRLGYGKYSRYIEGTISDATRIIGVDVAGDKELTKRLLSGAALPVPRGCVVNSREEAAACLTGSIAPVVVKPLDGNQGRGVSLNLTTPEQVKEAFDLARQVSRHVIVEEMFRGLDYRVVVVNYQMVAAAQRIPAHVWGDGIHTIRELINLANNDPRRGDNHEKPLTKINADPIALAMLKRHGRTLDDVPEVGQMVLLRESANLSTGGSARDVTDEVHPSIRKLCERAARVIGLDVCGIDLVLPDITQPFPQPGGIIEVNASPGIRMHHYPSEGQARDVGGAIVNMLYPPEAPFRIPVFSITGTNGKTTVTRMIRHVIASSGKTVGMTTTDGIWIGDDEIARGDMTGPWSARVVLSDPTVEVAVLETARGGIVRSGLGYDWSDVGIMLNIQADHIGQDGIESVEDILAIKRLVAERVREGGTLVLNADDELLASLPEHPKVQRVPKQIVYFSTAPQNPVVQRHLDSGGTAYVVKGEWIEEHRGRLECRVLRIPSIPATLGGTAEFQVYNLLAVVAACRAYGISKPEIANALLNYRLDRDSAGRLNLYAIRDGYVLVDYAHNPAALRAICRMAAQWNATQLTGIITAPGDRSDDLIEESGRAAACGFGRVIVREDLDRRGRQPGEVADLLAGALRRERPELSIEIVLDEVDAVRHAVEQMQPGEVVAAFSDRLDDVTDWLLQHGARAVPGVEEMNRERSPQNVPAL